MNPSKKIWDVIYSADTENKKVILDMLEKNISAKVLDCGCGNCDFTEMIGRKICTNDICGVDIAEKSLQICEKKNVKYCLADLNKPFPFPNEVFDVICANQVVEHIFETDIFLKECYRTLKWGGYALISTPNLASFHNIISLIFGWQPMTSDVSYEFYVGNPLNPRNKELRGDRKLGHIRLFTYRALKELLKLHGFKIEKIVGVSFYPFPDKIAGFVSYVDPVHSVYLTAKVRKP